MLRITFIIPAPNLSGGIRVVSKYAKIFEEMGASVVLISPAPRVVTCSAKIKSVLSGKGWSSSKNNKRSHIATLGLDYRQLSSHRPVTDLDVPDADIIIATWWETAEWVASMSPSKGKKVYFIQGHEVYEPLPVARCRATYLLPLKKIVVSNWLRNIMVAEYNDSDVTIVPNAVDRSQFYAAVRHKQKIPVVGFLYSAAPVKGLDVTLQALELIKELVPSVRFVSFGAKPYRNEFMKRLAVEYYLSPPQKEIKDIYAKCDVWLSSSNSEGFNLTAMEAMACRTPVISTRTGWPVDAISDGINGYLVEVGDYAGLAKAASRILRLTNSEWGKISANAFDTVKDSSWRASAKLFLESLQVLDSKSNPTVSSR